jgi:hypothetical protein
VRALRAEGGVTAVAGVDPGLVGQPVEDLRHHAVVQGREARLVLLGVANAAGEQAVAGEQVRRGAVGVDDQRDRPRGVADQVDHRQHGVAEGDGAAALHQLVGRDRYAGRVRRVRHGDGAGRRLHLGQALPVVAVLMRGHDLRHRGVADQLDQSRRLRRGIDEQPLAAAVDQQIGVVVHPAHGELGQRQAAADLPRVRRPADTHVSGVGHPLNLVPTPHRRAKDRERERLVRNITG